MASKELTAGKPLGLILGFMFPVFLGNIFQQFYHFFDALIVGRTLGIKSLAAVGATTPLIFLVISFIFASTQGFSVITAQKFGARDYDMVKKSLASSLILSGLLTLILTFVATPLTHWFLKILNTPSDILSISSDYLFIMFVGIFATVFYNVSSNIIRALGDSKTPLYFLIFSTIMNIVMDLIFILYFGWGIKGVAWATVCAQGISTILALSYMFWKFPILRLKKSDWKVSKNLLMEHLNVGIPMGFQMSVLTLGMIVLQFVLNGFGSSAIAAFTTSMRVDQLFSQAFLALGATMAVYTAQNFGAKKMSRIKEGTKIAFSIVSLISVFSICVIYMFSETMIGWFMAENDPEVLTLAIQYLHIIVIFFIFLGLLMLFRNILQGMGQVKVPLISGFAELFARGGCALLFGHYFGYLGICYASPAAWVSAAIVLYIGYKISLVKHIENLKVL